MRTMEMLNRGSPSMFFKNMGMIFFVCLILAVVEPFIGMMFAVMTLVLLCFQYIKFKNTKLNLTAEESSWVHQLNQLSQQESYQVQFLLAALDHPAWEVTLFNVYNKTALINRQAVGLMSPQDFYKSFLFAQTNSAGLIWIIKSTFLMTPFVIMMLFIPIFSLPLHGIVQVVLCLVVLVMICLHFYQPRVKSESFFVMLFLSYPSFGVRKYLVKYFKNLSKNNKQKLQIKKMARYGQLAGFVPQQKSMQIAYVAFVLISLAYMFTAKPSHTRVPAQFKSAQQQNK